ncbi:MAG: FAD-dependent oxidoreductase [Candidatus Pacebacteria bacterium]|nr:FAD-dependent oxidoreductase [Candidatus Paceibacterota bacterium]MBP9780477.1 FAD-dependent oxidoreductase [Candidatus Paceibacterota bacterium]
MIYDLIIIGAGPGGTAGAVYAARKQLNTLLVAKEIGGQSTVSETIYNWIGTPEISGHALAESFRAHMKAYENKFLTLKEGFNVSKVEKVDEEFKLTLENGEELLAKSVLITSGSGRRKLTIPGADIFEHKGITYCASCDGPLFSDQDVVVIGGGNAGFETAAQLLAYCKSVTLIHRSADFKADKITVEKVLANPKMKAITNAELLEVKGDKFVSSLVYKDKISGDTHEIATTGIFVEVGQIPNTGLVEDLVTLDDNKKIVVDPWTQRSSVEGIWSAGDATNGLYHQNNIATGDAVKALEDIYVWLKTR